jgi:zinc transport system permease protein
LALLVWRWQSLLTSTLNPELAVAAGISPKREQLLLTLALALTVAIAIKVVGALLISAMLLLPSASARSLSRTPEAMALWAVLIGVLAVFGGLMGSYWFDTPTGPSIVAAAALIFTVSLPLRKLAQ